MDEKADFASRVRSYGASGKRSPAQMAAARAAAAKIQAELPDHAIEIWTDGSRIGREIPGPSGAGAVIMSKGAVEQELVFYLGDSTNQAAELWAIGGALESIPAPVTGEREIHVFTDSQFSIDCLLGSALALLIFTALLRSGRLYVGWVALCATTTWQVTQVFQAMSTRIS